MTSYTHTFRVEWVEFGGGGWCRLHTTRDGNGPFVLVRVEDRSGRLTIAEFYVRGAVSDYLFDGLAPRRVEDLVNHPRAARVIRPLLDSPTIDLATASGYYAGGLGRVDDNGRGVTWVDEMYLAQFGAGLRGRPEGEGARAKRQVQRPADGPFIVEGVIRPAPADDNRPGVGLIAPGQPGEPFDVPDTRTYPREFYVAVAEVYRDAAAWGLSSPAQAVRARCRTRVPMSTVYRWIRAARKRGLLAPDPGRGRATA